MNPASEDLKDILVTAGIGTYAATSGWAIYVSKEPKSPDTVVTLYDYSGADPSPKFLRDNPNVQVRVRGAKEAYKAGWTKAQAVKDALLGLPGQTINATKYVGVWMQSDINFINYDDNNRPLFTLNFRITREPASGAYRT